MDAARPHIMLVEDEEAVREISTQMLNLLGYEVSTACDGLEALRLYGQNPASYDLLMLDINLPGMSGKQLLEEIRKQSPAVRAIFCSGDPDLEPGPDEPPHLRKPFRLAELKTCIETQLGAG
jgi:CheY-like chemotaxis protein